ncbi:SDR family NAD(P)-dependent oxidoreductase [Streptomyces sp. 900105755]
MRLRGKAAVVTGGGTGIGRAVAELFAAEGAEVVVSGRRKGPLDETVAAIADCGGAAVAVPCDATDAADVEQLTEATLRAFGQIDILVTSAGAVVNRTSVADCTDADFTATLDVNLRGAFLCSRQMVPELRRTRGNIVHIASVFALVGMPGSAAYTAAKGALVSMARATAVDLGPDGIRVNAVCPAYVETDLNREMLDSLRREGGFGAVLGRLPLGHLGEPVDIAQAVLYLASPLGHRRCTACRRWYVRRSDVGPGSLQRGG